MLRFDSGRMAGLGQEGTSKGFKFFVWVRVCLGVIFYCATKNGIGIF